MDRPQQAPILAKRGRYGTNDIIPRSAVQYVQESELSTSDGSVSSYDADAIPGARCVGRQDTDTYSYYDGVAAGMVDAAPSEAAPVNAYLVQDGTTPWEYQAGGQESSRRLQELEEALREERRFREQIIQAQIVGTTSYENGYCPAARYSFSSSDIEGSGGARRQSATEDYHQNRHDATATATSKTLEINKVGLCGRDGEVRLLGEVFANLLYGKNDEKRKSLVLIGGSSGTGKSALAGTLADPVGAANSFFVMGKSDLNQTDEPFTGIRNALNQLCSQILRLKNRKESIDEVIRASARRQGDGLNRAPPSFGAIQTTIRQELESEIDLLSRMIPELRELVGYDLVTSELADDRGSSEASDRFKYAFCRFMKVVTTFVPVVFVCDDLQWADEASIHLLESWIVDEDIVDLMVVGCYRANEVDEGHLLTNLTEAAHIRDSTVAFHNICVENLSVTDVNQMLAELFASQALATTEPLARVVHQKTLGNPFFLKQYLLSLHGDNLISYDGDKCTWVWNVDEIRAQSCVTDNVVTCLKAKMEESPIVSFVLPVAACLGAKFSLKNLKLVICKINNDGILRMFRGQEARFQEDILLCEKESFIENCCDGSFRFAHDKVQEAALSLVPSGILDAMQHEVGMILFNNLSDSELEDILFTVVNLVNAKPDSPQANPIELAKLNLRAAEKAKRLSAFASAAAYIRTGVVYLPDEFQETEKKLPLALYSLGAEAESAVGNEEAMDCYCQKALSQSNHYTTLELIRVHKVMIDNVGNTAGRAKEALSMCLDVLAALGCNFPKTSVGRAVRVIMSLMKVKGRGGLPDLYDVRNHFPLMSDRVRIEAMNMLDKAVTFSYLADDPLVWGMVITRMARWTVRFGLAEASPIAFVGLGVVFLHILKDPKPGALCGELAVSSIDRLDYLMKLKSMGLCHSASRSSYTAISFLLYWIKPIQGYSNEMLEAYHWGMRLGDIESALWNKNFHACIKFASSKPLQSIRELYREVVSQADDLNKNEVGVFARFFWQATLNLIEPEEGGANLSGSVFHEEEIHKALKSWQGKVPKNVYDSLTNLLCAFFGDYVRGAELAIKRQDKFLNECPGTFLCQIDPFFRGICLYAAARRTKGRSYLRHGNKVRKLLRSWVENGNPNVTHQLKILNAEHEACAGNREVAIVQYTIACTLASTGGFIQDAALAHERLLDFLLTAPHKSTPAQIQHHLQESIRFYEEWGAHAKVGCLQRKYGDLLAVVVDDQP